MLHLPSSPRRRGQRPRAGAVAAVTACLLTGLLTGVPASGSASAAVPTTTPTPAAVPAPAHVTGPLRDGTRLVVDRAPFRLRIVDRAGRTEVGTVAGVSGPPVRVPGIDGPEPVEPLGAAGGFPAVGFVLGAGGGVQWPLPIFTGNRIFGAEAGVLLSLVRVESVTPTTAGGVRLTVATDAPSLGPATVRIAPQPGGGVRVDADPPQGVVPASSMVTLDSPPGEGLYGLGARKDVFDQRGRLRNVWTEEQNTGDERADGVTCPTVGCPYTAPNGAQGAYLVQPSLSGSRGWTAWTHGTVLNRLDLAVSRPRDVRWGMATSSLHLSLAGGGLVRSAVAHTADVGRAPAPPSWIYRPWLDVINQGEGEAAPDGGGFTGGARVAATLRSLVTATRRAHLPVGVLGVEGWQSVPHGAALFARLRHEGYHLSAYWNPFFSRSNPAYAEAARRHLLITGPGGQPYPFVNNRGSVSYALDFSAHDARAYWNHQLARSFRLGFEGWMDDFGEFVTQGMTFADGLPSFVMHNRYPLLEHAAAAAAARAWHRTHPRFHPFFYARSGFDGLQRSTGGIFPGDETTDWSRSSGLASVVPAMLNAVMGGFPTFTTDVGGYFDFLAPRTTPELLVRWGQLAALTPVMRVHDSTQHHSLYPTDLPRPLLTAYRAYARLKVRLAPLVDRYEHLAARGVGLGPVRPTVLADPSPAARGLSRQWLLGRDLVVAPVLTPGARTTSVYLPRGSRWQRVVVDGSGHLRPVGPPRAGGRTRDDAVRLRDIVLYARVGGHELRRYGVLASPRRG